MRYGYLYFNTIFFVLLALIALFFIFYFLGWLKVIGLEYVPPPPGRPDAPMPSDG